MLRPRSSSPWYRRLVSWVSLLVWVSLTGQARAQCCRVNPVAGATNVGVLSQGTLRVIAFYRYGYSDTYFSGSRRTDLRTTRYSDYHFTGWIFSYGVLNRLTLDLEAGYWLSRTLVLATSPVVKLQAQGFSNGFFLLKYALVRQRLFEVTVGSGIKFPLSGRYAEKDGVRLPASLQPSTNATGMVGLVFVHRYVPSWGVRFFLLHRTELNGVNSWGYQWGALSNTSLFVLKSLSPRLMGLLQLRGEVRGRDRIESQPVAASGGYTFYVAPQVALGALSGWVVSALLEMPVYRYYSGAQLSPKWAAGLVLTYDAHL